MKGMREAEAFDVDTVLFDGGKAGMYLPHAGQDMENVISQWQQSIGKKHGFTSLISVSPAVQLTKDAEHPVSKNAVSGLNSYRRRAYDLNAIALVIAPGLRSGLTQQECTLNIMDNISNSRRHRYNTDMLFENAATPERYGFEMTQLAAIVQGTSDVTNKHNGIALNISNAFAAGYPMEEIWSWSQNHSNLGQHIRCVKFTVPEKDATCGDGNTHGAASLFSGLLDEDAVRILWEAFSKRVTIIDTCRLADDLSVIRGWEA